MSALTSQFRPATRITAAACVATLAGGLVVIGAGATVAAPGAPTAPNVAAAPAVAGNHDQFGNCGRNARYEADVESDDGGLETSFEINSNQSNEKWRIRMFQNGNRYFNQVITTDFERELDVESFRPDRRGVDTFKFTAKKVGGGGKCSVTLKR